VRWIAPLIVVVAGFFLPKASDEVVFSFQQKMRTEYLVWASDGSPPALSTEDTIIKGQATLHNGTLTLKNVRFERYARPYLHQPYPILPSWKVLSNYAPHLATSIFGAWDSTTETGARNPVGWRRLKAMLAPNANPSFQNTLIPLHPPKKERSITLSVPHIGLFSWKVSFKKEKGAWQASLKNAHFKPANGVKRHTFSASLSGRLLYQNELLKKARVGYTIRLDVTSDGVRKRMVSLIGLAMERVK